MEYYIQACVFLAGLAIGSFLNVVIYRLPKGYSIVRPGSFCPNCRKKIPWYENIPVISYLLLRGKCSNCGERISIRYPIVEISGGAIALFLYHRYGLSLDLFFVYSFVMALFAITLIDWENRIIPDELSLPFIIVGIVWSFLSQERSPTSSALGALVGGGGLLLIGYLYRLIRRTEGMGGGDIKLMAMIGAFVGIRLVFPVLLIASFAGSVYGIFLMRKGLGAKATVAFGSFLAPSAAICLIYGEAFLNYYLSHF